VACLGFPTWTDEGMGRLGPLNGQACMRMGRAAWTRNMSPDGHMARCGDGMWRRGGAFCVHTLWA